MQSNESILAHNIRFLRKRSGLSQAEMADRLEIKRSNIAAYESKNVEPRLRIVLEMAKLFDVSVKSLIDTRLDNESDIPNFDEQLFKEIERPSDLRLENDQDFKEFIGKSMKIRKVLEGFKAFYNFKKSNLQEQNPERSRITYDIDNFIQLMEHLLSYNETVIKAITNKMNQSSEGPSSDNALQREQ